MFVGFTIKTVVENPNIILVMKVYVLTTKTLQTVGYEKIKKGYIRSVPSQYETKCLQCVTRINPYTYNRTCIFCIVFLSHISILHFCHQMNVLITLQNVFLF